MKTAQLVVGALVVFAVLFAGCGKSDEMKKLEAGLNTEVMQKHDDLMKAMSGLDATAGQITSLIAKQDSLAKLFPKKFEGQTVADLVNAKEKLEAAKAAMMTWMKGFKPYDPEMKHEMVMESLTKTKDDLATVEKQIEDAMSAAKNAVADHSKVLDELTAKMAKKK
jgi:capsule polysaccharide export protein KpsE/RkpR